MPSVPSLIPLETLFGNPERAGPKLSPDGRRLAYLAPDSGVLNIFVGNVGSDEFEPVTSDRERGIRSYFWCHDNSRLFYIQDTGGDENWRLYQVDLATRKTKVLTPFDDIQVQVIEHTKHHPSMIIIGLNKDDERLHDAYLLDLATGDLTMVAKNPGNVVGWLVDRDLEVRAAMAARADGGFDLLVRDASEDEWRVFLTWSADENLNSSPVSFSHDGDSIYLFDSRNCNAARLTRVDIATGVETVILEDPVFDVSGVMIDPDTFRIQMVGVNGSRLDWTVLDEDIAAEVELIKGFNPGDFSIYDRTDADDVWLVGFTQDVGPTAYYALERATGIGRLLFYDRPNLARYQLATMEPISFPAGDGLTIHGYLTLPPGGGAGAGPPPMVLNVHGGPWARDVWGYDPEAQWLANRGYACLQVNYRGSTGFGKDFINAGDREWAGAMHQDLVDAVHWAITQHGVDPNRIAIYGGSYGGYAALVGATFTPDLFRCAVDIVGPSNLISFIASIPPYWSTYLEVLHRRVGNPETEREFLESRSPLFLVDQIKIPMLIAQGANDPRVKQAESEQIVAAMQAKGIDHEYLLFDDEGHGFAKPENRLKFYRAAEGFLAKHLGGRTE